MATQVNCQKTNTVNAAAIAADKTALALSLVKLIKADLPITDDTTVADLAAVEADYAGYDAVTVTAYGAVYRDLAGLYSINSSLAVFACSGGGTTNTIYGGWVELAGGDLYRAFKFDASKEMAVATDVIALVVVIQEGSNGFVIIQD